MVERRLGRGLEFFLSTSENNEAGVAGGEGEIAHIDLGRLEPSPLQPRREFPVRELDELARSIRSTGVLQPILVRPAGDRYQIIAGERRWRAAKKAGLERIPAVVREIPDDQAAVFGLVENLQREDLNAMEKAHAFRRIQDLIKGRQEDVARQVGLDRSTVTNFLRLLELPEPLQAHVSRGTLSMGHARALLSLTSAEEQTRLAEEVQRRKLSVRQLESWIQDLNAALDPKAKKKPAGSKPGRPVWVNEIEETLAGVLGTPVNVRYSTKRARISIECMGREEFERVYELLKGLGGDE